MATPKLRRTVNGELSLAALGTGTACSYTVPTGATVRATASVLARINGGGNDGKSSLFTVNAVARDVGGTLTRDAVGTPVVLGNAALAAVVIDIAASGNALNLTVAGIAAEALKVLGWLDVEVYVP